MRTVNAHDEHSKPSLPDDNLHGLPALRGDLAGTLTAQGSQVQPAFVGTTQTECADSEDVTAGRFRNCLKVAAFRQGTNQLVGAGPGNAEFLGDLGHAKPVIALEEQFENVKAPAKRGGGGAVHGFPILSRHRRPVDPAPARQ
jgi:hypothetical protein